MSDSLTPFAEDFTPEESSAGGGDVPPIPETNGTPEAPAGAVEQNFAEIKEAAAKALSDAQAQWKAVGDEALRYIRANPGKATLAGLGVGFALGLMFRRQD